MRVRASLVTTVLMAGTAFVALTAAPALADADKCTPGKLSSALHARMKAEGKTDAQINGILNNGMKRRIVRGRVAKGSGCVEDAVEAALVMLEDMTGQ